MFKIDTEKLLTVQVTVEREWRDAELSRADIMLNRVQDGMSGFGTVAQWRAYRIDLRNWPTAAKFPDVSSRPVAPDAE